MPKLTKEQLEFRKSGLGASEVAAVVGLSDHISAYQIWLEKTGKGTPVDGNDATEWAHRLEPIVAAKYGEIHNVMMIPGKDTMTGPEPWMLATEDYMAVDWLQEGRDWIVEIKTRSRYTMDKFGPPGTDQVPHDVLCQVLWQNVVKKRSTSSDVPVLVDGREYLEYTVPFDRELADAIIEQAREWWMAHVVKGQSPEVDGKALEHLKQRFKSATRTLELPQTDAMEPYLEDLAKAKHFHEVAKKLEEPAKAHIMEFMQDAYSLAGNAGSVRWGNRAGSTSWKSVALAIAKKFNLTPADIAEFELSNKGADGRQFVFTPAKSDTPIFVPEEES